MKAALLLIGAAVAVQLVHERTSAAYQLQPISQVFAPSGSQATQSFQVVNDGPERVAITISFSTLERDAAYVETNRDAEDEFLAYPAQMVLAAGAKQTVRVTWLGAPNPSHELAYRILVNQVPIEKLDHRARPATSADGKVRVLLNYRGTLLIRPRDAAPNVSVDAAVTAADSPRGKLLALTLANTGTALGVVRSCTIRLSPAAGGQEVALSAIDLAPLRNTRVLARSRRRYLLAWPHDLSVGSAKAGGHCSVEP